jgi:hypothetical protein
MRQEDCQPRPRARKHLRCSTSPRPPLHVAHIHNAKGRTQNWVRWQSGKESIFLGSFETNFPNQVSFTPGWLFTEAMLTRVSYEVASAWGGMGSTGQRHSS